MTTAARTPIEPHDTHSDRLMRHAFEQLDKGDRIQASEKAWGAVAHKIKAIAREREGLVYDEHSQAKVIIHRLSDESPVGDLLWANFAVAETLHSNFYSDLETDQTLKRSLQSVEQLLKMLDQERERWPAAGRPPSTPPMTPRRDRAVAAAAGEARRRQPRQPRQAPARRTRRPGSPQRRRGGRD